MIGLRNREIDLNRLSNCCERESIQELDSQSNAVFSDSSVEKLERKLFNISGNRYNFAIQELNSSFERLLSEVLNDTNEKTVDFETQQDTEQEKKTKREKQKIKQEFLNMYQLVKLLTENQADKFLDGEHFCKEAEVQTSEEDIELTSSTLSSLLNNVSVQNASAVSNGENAKTIIPKLEILSNPQRNILSKFRTPEKSSTVRSLSPENGENISRMFLRMQAISPVTRRSALSSFSPLPKRSPSENDEIR